MAALVYERPTLRTWLQVAFWVGVVAFALWGARYTVLEGVIYPLQRGFRGDFYVVLHHPDWLGVHAVKVMYGPIFMAILYLSKAWGAETTFFWFTMSNYALLLGAFLLMLFAMDRRPGWRLALLAAALWLGHWALADVFSNGGNPECLEVLFTAAALLCYVHRRRVAAGALIGLASMTKLLPAIFFGYLVAKRQLRALVAGLATCLLLLGWMAAAAEIALPTAVVWLVWNPSSALDLSTYNMALRPAIARLLRPVLDVSGVATDTSWMLIPNLLYLSIAIALVGSALLLYFWASAPGRSPASGDQPGQVVGLEWALLWTFMPLLAPQGHTHTMVFLLPVWTVLAAWALSRERWTIPLPLWIGLAVAYVLTGLPTVLAIPDRLLGTALGATWIHYSVPIWGQLLLAVCLLAAVARVVHLRRGGDEVAAAPHRAEWGVPTLPSRS